MWGQLRQVQQQQQQQQQQRQERQVAGAASNSSSAPTSTPASTSAAAEAPADNSNINALASTASAPDASCSAKTMLHSNVNSKNTTCKAMNNDASRDVHSGRKQHDAAVESNTAAIDDDIYGGDDDDQQQQWGFDDDPFFAADFDDDNTNNNVGIGDREQPGKPKKQNEEVSSSPDKSGRREQFAALKTGKQPPGPNDHDRRRSSLGSISEEMYMTNDDDHDDDAPPDNGDNGSSWPAMIDFESNNANAAGEFADASDNINDSSRSLGSTSRASMEEKGKFDRDLALIRNEQKADAKSMNMVNKMVVVPADTKSKDTPGKTPKAKNSKTVDDLADNDTAAAIVGVVGGGRSATGRGGTTGMQTRSQTQKQEARKIAANEHADEEDDELIPPSSTTSSRRLGASAGTRSAVKQAAQTQKQKQKAKEEMKLAERKFAAAVQKIADDDGDDGDNFGDNWDFEDDDAGNNDDSANDNAAGPQTTTRPGSDLHAKLVQYLTSLSGVETPLVRSLNSLLQAELNTDENCDELIHYYTTRPQLLDYTIETELPRMDYLVITPYDQYIDKEEIKLYVESTSDQRDSTENWIWRASNQSILADIIAALTGDDRLIRPSMMITAVAESCKFELNLVGGDGSNRGVAVMSDLVLSIPFADGEGESSRLELGKVKVRVLFVPELQQLEYSIVQATALIPPGDERLVAAAAALERDLAELGFGEAAIAQGPHVDQLSRTAHDQLRDQFLATVSTGALGLSSALREFDSVTNVSGKLGWLKAAMPSLPTADVIAQAESEATTVHGAPTTHRQGSFPRPSPSNMNANRGHGFLDRLADEGQPSVPSRAPPQPGARAMGFLDRLVNELEAPDQQQSHFPRPTPAPAPTGTNTNHFDDNEQFPRPPVQPGHPQPPSLAQVTSPATAKAPAAGKAPLIGGFLVRGLANAAKGLAEAAVAADELAEAQYSRQSEQKDEEVKFYRQPNDDHSDQKSREPNVPPPQHDELETNRVDASSSVMGHAVDANAHTNAPMPSEGDNIVDDSGGWSDDEDIGIDNDEATGQDFPAPKPDQRIKTEPRAEPSFRSFADRLSEAAEGSMAPLSSTAAPESEKFPRPVQNMIPASTAAPASIGGASVSTCDGSYQFVSMKSLQDELPEPKDWLAVEAVDAVDENGGGIIPTRTRWRPRRARA